MSSTSMSPSFGLNRVQTNSGFLFDVSDQNSPTQKPIFRVYSDDKLDDDSRVTIFWTGAAHFTYFVEMFDRLRLSYYKATGMRWSVLTVKAITPETDDFSSEMFEDSIVLTSEHTPFIVPESCDLVRLDYLGTLFEASELNAFNVIDKEGAHISFWGDVFYGSKAPSRSNDELGLNCHISVISHTLSSVATYIDQTSYSTARQGDFSEGLNALLIACNHP